LSVTITVRVPRELAEKMRRHREVNWSEVVRRSIEEYLERLEEAEGEESGARLARRLLARGLEDRDLEPLEPGVEEQLAERLRRAEEDRARRLWELERTASTTRAR